MTQIASEISKMIDMLPEERGRGFVIQRSEAGVLSSRGAR